MHYIYILSSLAILLLGLISGSYPLLRARKYATGDNSEQMPISECFSAGIFLSLGIFHMLPDSINDFRIVHVSLMYPLVLVALSCVIIFLLNIVLKFINKGVNNYSLTIALISLLILSIHSFFAGVSLGISVDQSQIWFMFFAIASHKWAASFTLGYQIANTNVKNKTKWILFILFLISTPIGILFGDELKYIINNPYLLPTFHAIASGTFIYLGLDHLIASLHYMKKHKSFKSLLVIILSFIFIYLTSFLE